VSPPSVRKVNFTNHSADTRSMRHFVLVCCELRNSEEGRCRQVIQSSWLAKSRNVKPQGDREGTRRCIYTASSVVFNAYHHPRAVTIAIVIRRPSLANSSTNFFSLLPEPRTDARLSLSSSSTKTPSLLLKSKPAYQPSSSSAIRIGYRPLGITQRRKRNHEGLGMDDPTRGLPGVGRVDLEAL
jgi:hypothetical protein